MADYGSAISDQLQGSNAHEVWVRGLPLQLDDLVVNRSTVLESTLSDIFQSLDDINKDLYDFKKTVTNRLSDLESEHESMGLAVGEILEACEVKIDAPVNSSEGVDETTSSVTCQVESLTLYGKAAVINCVQQRKDEIRHLHQEMARTRNFVTDAIARAEEAVAVIPRVDHFEDVATEARDNYQRLIEKHSAFSGFFGSEGAFTAGRLREELESYRKNKESLELQLTGLDAAVKQQRGDLDLSRKIEELRRLETAFHTTVQEQKAWTARRLQEMTLKIDAQPKKPEELEKSTANRIEIKLRGELKTLESKISRFEHLLAAIALPAKNSPPRSPSPPKELPSTTWQGDAMEHSRSSLLDLKASNLDDYADYFGNARSAMDTGPKWLAQAGCDETHNRESPQSPLQRVPSMDHTSVRVRIQSRRASEKPGDGLPKWFQEHRSAVLSSKGGSDMRSGVLKKRPQSARPYYKR